jgi:RNA polymerase sigma-70 factor (ECF subfamily)
MPADEADRLLVARIRQGDSGAWEEFIDRFEGRLLAYVESRLRNRSTSEDVVQETFMGFLVSLPNYDENTPLVSYLFSIAAYKLIDVLRREGRRPTIPLFVPDSQGRAAEPAGPARRASSLLRSREDRVAERQIITNCLQSLIDRWVERGEFERFMCIELLFVLGMTNKDAADRLGISEQAVANHKHFVVGKLKEAATRARLRDFNLADFGIDESGESPD